MRTSDDGIAFIKRHEGVRYDAYQDSIGVWTIGVGHTGPDVVEGLSIDDAEVDRLLAIDLEAAERCIETWCDVALSQNQFDALVSFIFNVGCGNFKHSTLMRLVNEGNWKAAAQQFGRWIRAGGRVIAGLTTRREEEAELFASA